MLKIRDKLSDIRSKYICLSYSIIILVIGISLILNSTINISSFKGNSFNQNIEKQISLLNTHEDFSKLKNNFNNKKIKKLTSSFVVREDLSIKDLYINFIPNKNNDKKYQFVDQTKDSNGFDLQLLDLNNEISTLDLQRISNEFYSNTSLTTKKEKFIISILPHIVQENEKIRVKRKRLLEIRGFLVFYKTLNTKDRQYLESLATEYKINTLNKHKIDIIAILLEYVDVIPNSIVLAQAANESGWGTSRFATEFNAFFGEYTFDTRQGVVPTYRDSGEKYLIKFFSAMNESVISYFRNLNTHPAYKEFRETRKNLRNNNLSIDPLNLIKYLKPYAKDQNYIKTIESIIKTNNLIQFDKIRIITRKS